MSERGDVGACRVRFGVLRDEVTTCRCGRAFWDCLETPMSDVAVSASVVLLNDLVGVLFAERAFDGRVGVVGGVGVVHGRALGV